MKVSNVLILACVVIFSLAQAICASQPDQIPDGIAYELILTAASRNPIVFLEKVGLTERDQVTAFTVIREFALEKQAHLDALSAGHESTEQYRHRCDELVKVARTQLKARLTKSGAAKFDAFVQAEKVHMHIERAEEQPGGSKQHGRANPRNPGTIEI